MRLLSRRESGQAVVEFAIIGLVLLMLTVGLVDSGRAFYQYNAVSAAARYGARWASVVGGTCALPYASSTNDFCNQLSNNSNNFWSQDGNKPIQGVNVECPDYSVNSADYYAVSTYKTATATTIVGAVAQRFDSSSTSSSFIIGGLSPGFDLTKLEACVELDSNYGTATPSPGDTVTVVLYYPFKPLGSLLPNTQFSLEAQSQYQVE